MDKTVLTHPRKSHLYLLFILLALCSFVQAQNKVDSITDDIKNKMFQRLKNFTFGFYVDAYVNQVLKSRNDTSDIVPFSSNCPVENQIRLNVAAIEVAYNAEKIRGKLALQFGDAPNLLADPSVQFIKNLRQANFGFRIVKNLWIDFGYMLNPVGYESAWPVLNQFSTVTIGGYYEPGSILGVKLSYQVTDKLNLGFVIGNPYSVAYGKNTHLAGMLLLTYNPLNNLSITYNNFFGNQALVNADISNNIFYNNLIVTYTPVKLLELVGQLDFAIQTNSSLPPDTNMIASMFSGFIQARVPFNDHFAIMARYEFFNDPDGFLSGIYYYKGKTRGLLTYGIGCGIEYKPVKIGYIRVEYRYINSNTGNYVFHNLDSDNMQAIIFTTGVRF